MIAERIVGEQIGAADPIGLDPVLTRNRPQLVRQETENVREHGAWACWRSVLFGMPTDTEVSHAIVMEGERILWSWRRGKENRDETSWKPFALASARSADVEVVEHLLLWPEGQEVIRAALVDAPQLRVPTDCSGRRSGAVSCLDD
jgi:hypothetical protein